MLNYKCLNEVLPFFSGVKKGFSMTRTFHIRVCSVQDIVLVVGISMHVGQQIDSEMYGTEYKDRLIIEFVHFEVSSALINLIPFLFS